MTRLIKDEAGAGMVEYALLACLIGVLLIGALIALTGGVNNAMGGATTALGGTAPAAPAANPLPGSDESIRRPGNRGKRKGKDKGRGMGNAFGLERGL